MDNTNASGLTRNQRRRKNKGKSNNQTAEEVVTATTSTTQQTVPESVEEETPESKLRARMAEKVIDLVLREKMVIFGSYVREYLCRRPFDLEMSDIDIYSSARDVKYFSGILSTEGFCVNVKDADPRRYRGRDVRPFEVYHCTLRMINDDFFLGKSLEIKVDFVEANSLSEPPFEALDFSCNAWIWDEHGIRLSRKTGTDLDKMSPRDIKDVEIKLLDESKHKVATYYPLDKEGALRHLTGVNIYRRKVRVERIVKMLERGWTIPNITSLIETQPTAEDICSICQEAIEGTCLRMPCCVSKYHRSCFVHYAKSELEDRTHVRCLQRCTELLV
jgi:predicted nucleotidyltransferase